MNFKVNNTIYKVKELDSPHNQVDYDEEAFGITVFSHGLIFLEKNLIPSVKRSTLIHELTHAHLMEYGISQEHKTIEEVCDFMGAFADTIVGMADKYFKKNGGTNVSKIKSKRD
jgi:Zn-dependent peptidase ImmA (M78 family)